MTFRVRRSRWESAYESSRSSLRSAAVTDAPTVWSKRAAATPLLANPRTVTFLPLRSIRPGMVLFLFLSAGWIGCPQLRASTEHLLSVRGARAQGTAKPARNLHLSFKV